jgi:sugar phosphate isomerase/epimerase
MLSVMAKHLLGCTLWSLNLPDTVQSLETAAQMGFRCVQFTFRQESDIDAAGMARIREALKRTGLAVPGGMVGFIGEDWTSITSIRRTGGIVDPATLPERLERCRRWGAAMAALGIRHVTSHAGFLPEAGAPNYAAVLDRLGQMADAFHAAGLTVGLETGQESAAVLMHILKDLGRDWVTVNYDPANFILYASDDPVRAARVLGLRVSIAHMKDGLPSAKPGELWGDEVPLGTGKVDFRAVVAALEAGGFTGALIIEREAGTNRLGDIAAAKRYLEALMA